MPMPVPGVLPPPVVAPGAVAAAAAVTTAAAVAATAATLYALPPAAAPILVNGQTYYTVGDIYYQPVIQGGTTVYIQVPAPF
jgi:hypothetical protein